MAPKKQTQSPLRRSPRLAGSSPAADPPRKKAKTKKSPKEKAKKSPGGAERRTIIVEHCKKCKTFKSRAMQVKKGLEGAVQGIRVVLNPQPPRKGCFEIRQEDGEAFVSLFDMEKPYTPMKELVMEDVISDILQRIK